MPKYSSFRIEGARELENFMLRTLPAKMVRSTMLSGMRRAAQPMLNIAEAKVAVRSGALRQSLGIKAVRAKGGYSMTQLSQLGGQPAFAAIEVGPLSGSTGKALHAWARYKAFYRQGVSIKRGGRISPGQLGRIRHGHLVEFGFRHRSGRQVAPQPFLKPAFQIGYPLYRRRFVMETRKKVEQAIKRHNAKSRGPR